MHRSTETLDMSFMRLPEILKIIPVGKSTWWAGVKSGRYPQPLKISARVTAWRTADIHKLSMSFSEGRIGSNFKDSQ